MGDLGAWLTQVYDLIKTFGSLVPLLQVAGIITVLISALKVSSLNFLWDKLGWAQMLLAPALASILAVVNGLAGNSGPLNLHAVIGAIVIGLTSVGFHELLDAIKMVPGIGPVWQDAINFVEQLLGGNTPTPPPPAAN